MKNLMQTLLALPAFGLAVLIGFSRIHDGVQIVY